MGEMEDCRSLLELGQQTPAEPRLIASEQRCEKRRVLPREERLLDELNVIVHDAIAQLVEHSVGESGETGGPQDIVVARYRGDERFWPASFGDKPAQEPIEKAVHEIELASRIGQVAGDEKKVWRAKAAYSGTDAGLQFLLDLPPQLLAAATQVQIGKLQPPDRSHRQHQSPDSSCCAVFRG
jgi:hypothetical protein